MKFIKRLEVAQHTFDISVLPYQVKNKVTFLSIHFFKLDSNQIFRLQVFQKYPRQ